MATDRPLQRFPAGASLYLHVPFCEVLCDFCAFAKAKPSRGDWALFREGFEAEWDRIRFEGKAADAFWGGGTPGLLKAADIRRIGGRFAEVLEPGAEWTVELTPRCATAEKLAAWREVGVNRLSLGVQSFSDRLLRAMGRPYSTEGLARVVRRIREAGFRNLNFDLIIAFPGQTPGELRADLAAAVALEPDHVSAYCLTLEEDTPLYLRLASARKGRAAAGDPAEEAALYEEAWAALADAGYRQYEISNFARPGKECAHHRNVWRMGDWRGIGPSAGSQIGPFRFRNPEGLREWHRSATGPGPQAFEGTERIPPAERVRERIAFGLRMNEGIDRRTLGGMAADEREALGLFLGRLSEEGLLEEGTRGPRLTLRGRLVADEISRWILGELFLARPRATG